MNFAIICLIVLTISSMYKSQEYYTIHNAFSYTPNEKTVLERIVKLSKKDFSSGEAKDEFIACARSLVKHIDASNNMMIEGYLVNCSDVQQQDGASYSVPLQGDSTDLKNLFLDNYLTLRLNLYSGISIPDKKLEAQIVGMYYEDFEEQGPLINGVYEFSSNDDLTLSIKVLDEANFVYGGMSVKKAGRRLILV